MFRSRFWTKIQGCRQIEITKLILTHKNFDISRIDNDSLERIIAAFRSYDDGSYKIITEILVERILDCGMKLDKNLLKKLIGIHTFCSELLMSRIFSPLDLDRELAIEMLKYHKNKIIYFCNLHINTKKEILENICSHREKLYCKPNNIAAMCSEINFNLKIKSKRQIFDIRSEDDMIRKISYHLD